MTEQEMSEAQARLDAATPGPWKVNDDPLGPGGLTVGPLSDLGDYVCELVTGDDANAEFIAHAPDDIRKALAALQRVRTALIVNSYEMNSWSKAVSVADILTALNGTEAIKS